MELWIGALVLGLIYSLMTIGVYITYRILDFPDITVDGSFTTGAAVSSVLIISGYDPFLSLVAAFLAGGLAGMATGLIHTKMKVNGLLSGILVMIALYSINLHIMGRSNVPLLNVASFTTFFNNFNPGLVTDLWLSIVLVLLIIISVVIVSYFFKTDFGLTLRSTGDNAVVSSALGVNVDFIKVFTISLSNAFVGLAGAIVAQYQGFADIGMGIGMIVNGLAAVIIGETILKFPSIYAKIGSAAIGSIIFRYMIAFALFIGLNPIDLKLLTALFVLLTIFISTTISHRKKFNPLLFFKSKTNLTVATVIIIGFGIFSTMNLWKDIFTTDDINSTSKRFKVGIVQITSNGILDITREAFKKEMIRLGYDDTKVEIFEQNANGDVSTLNSIMDNFLNKKVDLILTISTPATQAALNKIKNIPIVFATVANPFIIGAGTDENNHLPNVTGTYGSAPMDKTMQLVTEIMGNDIKIGTIWDNSQANSEFNYKNLVNELKNYPNIKLAESTVNSSSEVQTAASSLISKNVKAFVLIPDNTVYSSFDAIVKVANDAKIPIIISDVERIKDGALAGIGYDYIQSGNAAANIVVRIINGEKPATIPFHKYNILTYGLNIEVADLLKIKFGNDLIYKANQFIGTRKLVKKYKIGVIQFAQEPNVEIAKKGILHALAGNGYVDGQNIEILYRNANADFPMINSIVQDLISRKVDIIVPLSTPVVQATVQQASKQDFTKVVFTYIYDPYRIGAAKSANDVLPNFTGVSCFPPIEDMIKLIVEMFPSRKNLGIVWNSSEANSESVVIKIRQIVKKYNINLIETTVSSPSEVLDASKALIIKGAQVFLNAGDNTLNVAYDSFAKVAKDNNIPLFSVDAELIYNNTIAALGPNYYRTGFDGGIYLAKILQGKKTSELPILQTKETSLYINLDVAKKLNYKFSDNIIKRADKIIQDSSEKKVNELSSNLVKKKVAIFLFNDNAVLGDVYNGIHDTFVKNNVFQKYNISEDVLNAQNDFGNAQMIAKEIVQKKYDYIVTISTPALQTMAGVNDKIPHIFGAVTDPYSLGVATSTDKHRPNITGVATFQPVESTIKLIRELFPMAQRIGLMWNPAEACSFACTIKARAACKKYNFKLIETNVSSTGDIIDGINYLIKQDIDIVFTSGDNTISLAIEPISKKLRVLKIPYFTNAYSDVQRGAFISLGADYYQVGSETAMTAMKVFEGKNPLLIPIKNYVPEKLNLNLALAEEYNIHVPDALIKRYNDSKGGQR